MKDREARQTLPARPARLMCWRCYRIVRETPSGIGKLRHHRCQFCGWWCRAGGRTRPAFISARIGRLYAEGVPKSMMQETRQPPSSVFKPQWCTC